VKMAADFIQSDILADPRQRSLSNLNLQTDRIVHGMGANDVDGEAKASFGVVESHLLRVSACSNRVPNHLCPQLINATPA